MDRLLWHHYIWKEWHARKFRDYITDKDIKYKAIVQHYPSVFKISDVDGDIYEFPITNTVHQKIVFVDKGREKYLLPVIYEEEFPIKPLDTFECLIKKSDKTVYKFIKGVASIKIPADSEGKTFRQFVDGFNPVQHSNPKHWTLMKLLAIASKYKGIGLCACSTPAFGKNANFTLLKYTQTRVSTHKSPTPAMLYQSILTNDVIIFDEFTTTKKDVLAEIESTILGLKDSTPELPKEALTIGSQKAEANLVNKSIVFTYNRLDNLRADATFIDHKWSNPDAFKSRFPQFLFQGRVLETMTNPTVQEIQDTLDNRDNELKSIARQISYWVQNIGTALKGFDRSALGLKERHYTNAEGWIDAIEAYCETQLEFTEYLIELNSMRHDYELMVKGIEPSVPNEFRVYEKEDMKAQKQAEVTLVKKHTVLKDIEDDIL